MLLETIFQTLRPDEQIYVWCKDPHERKLFDSPAEVAEYVESRPTSDLYFGPSPRVRGTFDDISRCVCVWADLDFKNYGEDPKKTAGALSFFPVHPTFIVMSGHGYHVYWILKEAISKEHAQEIGKGIQKITGSDPVHSPGHVFRIPGTRNWKDPELVVPVEITVSSLDRVYAGRDLRALAKLGTRSLRAIATGSTNGFQSRSERDWTVIRELLAIGVSAECIRTIAEQKPIGDRWKEDDFRLLNHDLQAAKGAYAEGSKKFLEHEECWLFATQKGKQQVSTFIFDPERLLQDVDGTGEDVFIGRIRASGREWSEVTFPRSCFSSAQALLRRLPSMFWQWMGNDYQTKQLLIYLMSILSDQGMPEAYGTHVIGRHRDYWVTKTETLDATQSYAPSDAPYIYVGRKSVVRKSADVTPSLSYSFPSDDDYRMLVQGISEHLGRINIPSAVAPMIGWFFASPIKTLLEQSGIRFPILNVFGTMGSGKTASIVNVFLPLLGMAHPKTQTGNTTKFILRTILSCTNAVPSVFGEFRESTTRGKTNDFFPLLRMLYDTGMDSRGHADQTTTTYMLSSPVVVDGEDAFGDAALKQRSVAVNLHPEDIAERTSCSEAFIELLKLDLTAFGGKYIQKTLLETPSSIAERFSTALQKTQTDYPDKLPDRVRKNLAVIGIGITLYNEHVEDWGGTPFAVRREMLTTSLDNVLLRLADGTAKTLVDNFVEDLIVFVANEDNVRIPFMCFYRKKTNVLWIHLSSSLHWWQRDQNFRGKGSLDALAMRAQMNERTNGAAAYVVPETLVETPNGQNLHCFGLKVNECYEAGLQVPDSLHSEEMVIRSRLLK